MKNKNMFKLFGVIAGIASISIMIRNFFILTFLGKYTVIPDPLNPLELIMAIIAMPAIILMFKDIVRSD